MHSIRTAAFEFCIHVRLPHKNSSRWLSALEQRSSVSFSSYGKDSRLNSKIDRRQIQNCGSSGFQSDKPELWYDPFRRMWLLLPLKTIKEEPKMSDIPLNIWWATKVNKEVIVIPTLYFFLVVVQSTVEAGKRNRKSNIQSPLYDGR